MIKKAMCWEEWALGRDVQDEAKLEARGDVLEGEVFRFYLKGVKM